MSNHINNHAVVSKFLLAMLVALTSGLVAQAQCEPAQTFKLLPDDGAAGDYFGSGSGGGTVAISGSTAIVGMYADDDNGDDSGSAYLFDTATGMQIAKLLPDDGAAGDQFGLVVAISGNTAIVGARYDDDNGDDSGSAYLFDATSGQQIAKLLPDDGAAGDGFGYRISISGTTAIVGSLYSEAAYLFDTTTGQQLVMLKPDVVLSGDGFGRSVAISGTIAIVGAPYDDETDTNAGSAYLFNTTTGQQIARLRADFPTRNDYFGNSVAISGTIAIVGCRLDDDNGNNSGSAYLFDAMTGSQIAKLLPDDGAEDDWFGIDVAIDGTTAIIGAFQDDDLGDKSGSAYLFDATSGQQLAKLLPNDGAADDRFGNSVAINGTTAVIGANRDDDNGENSGSAYLFDLGCSDVVIPDSFLVTRGTHVAGGAVELAESDNADLSLQRATSDIQSRTEFEVKAVSPVASPTSLEVTLEGSVFARSTVNQTIELFDYIAGAWEQVDTRAATRFTDSAVTVAASGDLSRFVETGTMCIEARIRYQSPVARQQFSSNTDQFVWMIGQ